MYLIYLDDSHDKLAAAYSALAIPALQWKAALARLRAFRRALRGTDGIYTNAELRAWKFVSGRGRPGDGIVPKARRVHIYREFLAAISSLPGARLFNAYCPMSRSLRAFERLANRINRAMTKCDACALLFCDRGNEGPYTQMLRRMSRFNPIPSQYGKRLMNVPTGRIIENPIFKNSESSYFIQAADFAAYALLRRERPDGTTRRYGASDAFNALAPILAREASRHDPEGMIRVQ